jgi:hypothetical protein
MSCNKCRIKERLKQWLAIVIRNQQDPNSNITLKPYALAENFHGFSQPSQDITMKCKAIPVTGTGAYSILKPLGSYTFQTVGSQMAVRLSALDADCT